ncbi:hypothetical protein [Aureispira sp. CCB-QB1]|uniref:hypothetical protein n=1 Tax=Aureispira sp. CCB-QB1 TaxID=1313421 RepID=UPI000698F537|nr:hypothetical protein [Aureispira sp. CCB-QB1]
MQQSLRSVILLVVLSMLSANIFAQDLTNDLKSWLGYSINVKIGKRFKVSFAQLYSVDIATARFGFAQSDLKLGFKIASRNYLQLEYSNAQYRWSNRLTNFGLSENLLGLIDYQRFTISYNTSHKLLKKNKYFRLKHYVSAQVFFPQPEKHRMRFIYTARIYYTHPKWPLKLKPYISNSLYYYLGGRPISYYDDEGNVIAYNAPNGFHRIRIKTGCSLKPLKKVPFTVTLYLIFQWEFNNYIFPNQEINYQKPISLNNISYPFKPISPNIQYPFNNYITIGLHFSYQIKVKIKKKDARQN